MQTLFLTLLGFFARIIVLVKKPYIIGVTGTVGKTTITSHIAAFLSDRFWWENVMISPYHYNGEFWLPLSIIWARSGGKNPFLWLWVFCIAIFRLFRSYPRYLVLEYGIDRPGEMSFLLSVARPDIAIISPIAPNHLEQFGTFDRYRKEKLIILESAKRIVAHESLRQYIDRDAMYFSMWGMSDIDASHMHMSLDGVRATVFLKESQYDIHVKAFWAYQIENILPVYAVAHILGIDPATVMLSSQKFVPEAWRSSILAWSHDSVIIDGSYNWGFESLSRGIDSMIPFASTHRLIFLLGDMRELGEHAEEIHTRFAKYIVENIDRNHTIRFFCVWPLMWKYVVPIIRDIYPTSHALSSRVAGKMILEYLDADTEKTPSIIYVKWSQNTIFLEEGIKIFLRKQEDIQLLCRQSTEWMRKKEIFFKKITVS